MAGDAFQKTLTEFRDWAGTTGHKLSGEPDEVAGDLAAVFDLMRSGTWSPTWPIPARSLTSPRRACGGNWT